MRDQEPISRQLCTIATVLTIWPDGDKAIEEAYIDMIRANESEKEMIITMAGVILDGMKFGNWPKP